MPFWRLVVILFCAALLVGCLPVVSTTPVGTTAGLGADKALYGTWKGHSPEAKDQQDGFLHIMQAKDGSLTAALILADGGSDDGWSIFHLRTAALGKNHYLNAVMTFDKDAPAEGKLKNANIPLFYVVKDKTLTLSLLDEDKVKEAIKAGTLKGTIEPGDNGDAVITASGAELDAFFAKPEAAALFKRMMVMKRVE